MKLGFAVITEKNFMEKIVSIENALHDECHFFDRLGTDHNLPHTTLFQGNLDDRINYMQIADLISKKLRSVLPSREIDFLSTVYVPKGWYFWECVKSQGLIAAHDETLSMVKSHIILDPGRLDRNLSDLSELQIKAIRKYGYRYAGQAFYPHITIGRTEEREDRVLEILNEKLLPQKTHIERVTVYEMGDNGTHKNTLYEVYL